MLLTLFQIYNEYDSQKERLTNSLITTEKLFSKALSNAVWNLDEKQISSNAFTLISLDNIIGLSIIDPQKYIIGRLGTLSNDEKKHTNFLYEKNDVIYQKNLIQHTFKLVNKEFSTEVLATVTLYATYKQIINYMEENVIFIIINSMIKSLVLMLLFLYFSNKIITKSLQEIIKTFNNTNLESNKIIDIKKINIPKDNELEILVDSYNNMQQRINEEIEKNRKKDLVIEQKSKLESMGEMIGNIAHQWRQPLNVISTLAGAVKIRNDLGKLDTAYINKSVNDISSNVQYLSKTIDDFRDFIKGDNNAIDFNLTETINKSLTIEASMIKDNSIKMIMDLDDDINLHNYPNALLQVLVNIINNTRDIFKEKEIKQNKFIFINTYIKDECVILKIKDNAGGIPTDILHRVFEAYFTTKHESRGTGLGLHMSYNIIVNNMKGLIQVENSTYEYDNQQYTGAQFIIKLPLSIQGKTDDS